MKILIAFVFLFFSTALVAQVRSENISLPTLKGLDDEWKANTFNIPAMEANLQKRASLSLPVDSLLDVYVSRLPADSLVSVRVLQFIASQSPSLFSNANWRLKLHRDLFLKIWYNWPKERRVQINNNIIYKSMQEAIKQRSEMKAREVATYSSGTYPEYAGVHTKLKAYDQQMLEYYVGVNDPIYLSKAVSYYDKYYYTLALSEIGEVDVGDVTFAQTAPKEDTIWDRKNKGRFTIRKKVANTPRSAFYSTEISYLATLIYTSTNDKVYLSRALNMAAKAKELYETASTLDTYAKILYKLGNKADAIAWEEKAINFNKARKLSTESYERALIKMKTDMF